MNKILLLFLLMPGSCFASAVANIYVVPKLSTADFPLCNAEFQIKCFADINSLEKILANVSYFKTIESHASSVTVNFSPGVYRLNKAVEIKWPAVSSANQLKFKSSGEVVISGAKVIDYFYPVKTQDVARLNSTLDKKVMVAVVRNMLDNLISSKGKGFGWPIKPELTELFFGNEVMRLARWPNHEYGKIAALPGGPAKNSKYLAIEGQRLVQWSKEPSLNVFAYWFHNWASETLAVESIDFKSNTLILYGNGSRYGIKEGQRVYVENALSELDDYNEWYLDEKSGLLYFIFPKY
ncbi:MAG: hypothetical protein K2Q15_02380, partial [Burkholderiales bacterium]|nr:hypothetical protein [Burkholderiales bacterium]